MKRVYFKVIIVFLFFTILGFANSKIVKAQRYRTTDLGTLGGNYSYADLINNKGQVAGRSSTALGEPHAFLWTIENGLLDLGTLGGTYTDPKDLNDLGQVVGLSRNTAGDSHAFLWTAEDGIIDLGTLGGKRSEAYSINNLGQVVGRAANISERDRAFLWTSDDGMIDLGTVGGNGAWAQDINNNGLVVGRSFVSWGGGGTYVHAFLWYPDNEMIDLGSLYGYSGASAALGVNDNNQIMGRSWGAPDLSFFWTSEDGMIDLGTIGEGHTYAVDMNEYGQIIGSISFPGDYESIFIWTYEEGIKEITHEGFCGYVNDINNLGQVVGQSYEVCPEKDKPQAFIWDKINGMQNLNELIAEDCNCLLKYANAINDSGQIIGSGVFDLDGDGVFDETRGFLLTPVPTIEDILDFFDESVENETLEGNGPGNSDEHRLNAFRNMLERTGELIGVGDTKGACHKLQTAYKKCDGEDKPDDMVAGEAAPELMEIIDQLMLSLGCE